jgi:hypothetical protein
MYLPLHGFSSNCSFRFFVVAVWVRIYPRPSHFEPHGLSGGASVRPLHYNQETTKSHRGLKEFVPESNTGAEYIYKL